MTYLSQKSHLAAKILELLADGKRRRCKDIKSELAVDSLRLCSQVLTRLHDIGKIRRSEQVDPRESFGTQVAFFYREDSNV